MGNLIYQHSNSNNDCPNNASNQDTREGKEKVAYSIIC